jgi:hypothetical protein
MTECAVVFRQRRCVWAGCGAIFYICRSCDRGHRYCGDVCRQKSRRQQRREANRRYQLSLEGKLDHRDRQQAFRDRQRERVTDQGSATVSDFVSIGAPQTDSDETTAMDSPRLVIQCIVCGRSGYWIESFYASG